ncbi:MULTISPECIES: FRG domain-containing protein [Clostridium]|uniref:FRG domain-containing protein n=1 Tax=Clostridium TaxID=1485 RepID=UPI0018AB22BB|nr:MULTISPECIES: FRG domain-containing protein [Clostridium]MCQ2014617.1 FRG domain-containing protein [Clostridium butyricum]MCQ2026762.1 FRG domain-containing protein [Clostridium butyricum]MDB2136767.1 FRG domain-containing protein [Clostridium butyricum]MDU1115052.1 FRG domain-containing protein [Clostridium sp.]
MFSKGFYELLNAISQFSIKNDGRVWFRGQSKNTYKLNSSLYRLKYDNLGEFINLENQQLNLLKVNSNLLEIGSNEIERLYLMQHYGMRTRLLDWTSNISIALFFLSLEWTSDVNARLWMLNPCKLNELAEKGFGLISPNSFTIKEFQEMNNSIAIYPIRNNKRIIAQHGYFTVQGNIGLPLEEEFNCRLIEEGYLKYIDLSYELKRDIINFLKINDVNEFTVFPDMEGLKDYVNKTFIEERFK